MSITKESGLVNTIAGDPDVSPETQKLVGAGFDALEQIHLEESAQARKADEFFGRERTPAKENELARIVKRVDERHAAVLEMVATPFREEVKARGAELEDVIKPAFVHADDPRSIALRREMRDVLRGLSDSEWTISPGKKIPSATISGNDGVRKHNDRLNKIRERALKGDFAVLAALTEARGTPLALIPDDELDALLGETARTLKPEAARKKAEAERALRLLEFSAKASHKKLAKKLGVPIE